MPTSRCFVPGCRTGCARERDKRRSEGKRSLSLFKVPRDPEMFQKWAKAIPRVDKELSEKDCVCEVHFNEDEVQRNFTTILPGGIINNIKRGRPALQKDAIPSIFPSLPKYFTKVAKKRKPPAKRYPIPIKKEETKPQECSKNDEILKISNIMANTEKTDNISLAELSKKLSEVKKPNKWWAISYHETFIICVKWNENFVAERKLVIDADLKVQVFLHDYEVTYLDSGTVKSLEDVSKILQIIEGYVICASVTKDSKKNKNCEVFAGDHGICKGRPRIWCNTCVALSKK